MSDEKPPQNLAADVDIDSPISLRLDKQSGALTIETYRGYGKTGSIQMNLVFSPEASGQLVSYIKTLLEDGRITLEKSSSRASSH
jgi:hypothetical protein